VGADAVIRVVLVDDQELVRTGFRLVLRGVPDIEVVGEAGDGQAAVELLRSVAADVVVMDVRMPRMDGVEATRLVRLRPDAPKVLILTTFDLDEYVYSALKAGASGFLLKDTGAGHLIDGIRSVHSGDAVVAPSATRRLLDRFIPRLAGPRAAEPPGNGLTAREREVLERMAGGLSNAEIAAKLVLSEATVRTHVGHILAKLGVRDRVQAVVYAYGSGLVRAGA
jgi:DNA-binding NarL/FixJ family response regulator